MTSKKKERGTVWRRANSKRLQAYNRDYLKANPEKAYLFRRRAMLKAKYGMTLEEYDLLLAQQGGRCALCPRETNLHIDHDHTTGRVRGILCIKCNHALGVLGDDLPGLDRATSYLNGASPHAVS
jgi:hypothetical protein